MNSPQFDSDGVIDVLIVDPRPEDYERLALAAAERDLVVRKTRLGQRALELASQSAVALWLTNITLPDMSGLELIELIRARRPDAPCLIIGDSYASQDEIAARTAGASAYLVKPIDPAWLRLSRGAIARAAIRKGAPTSLG